jgi:hypothetical protein
MWKLISKRNFAGRAGFNPVARYLLYLGGQQKAKRENRREQYH